MRISTNQFQQAGVNTILDQQATVSRTQQQLATGKRLLTAADDPAGAARSLDLAQAVALTEQYLKNADVAETRLALEESSVAATTYLLQRARELAVQSNNGALTNEDRRSLALEIRQRLDELLTLANTRDANGEHIFAGYQGWTQPFNRDAAGSFVYSGDDGQRFLQIGPTRQIAVGDSGNEVFRAIRNGNGIFSVSANPINIGTGVIDPGSVNGTFVPDTYTISFIQALPTDPITYEVRDSSAALITSGNYVGGAAIGFNGAQVSVSGTPADGDTFTVNPSANQDIFTTLDRLAAALETDAQNPVAQAALRNGLNRSLVDIDQALEHMTDIRSRIGARLNAIDAQRQLNEEHVLQSQTALSAIQDLDYAEAISRLNLQLTVLEAAQQAYLRVQGLSLFSLLR